MDGMPLTVLDIAYPQLGLGGTASGTLNYRAAASGTPVGDGNRLTVGCICVGWNAEIRSGDWRVITSPVRAITSVKTSGWVQ